MQDLESELNELGFKPIIIDENTDFSKLPVLILDKSGEPEVFENAQEYEKAVKKRRNNKVAGSNWEREIVIRLNELGFNVGTTRNLSTARDGQKVDIMGVDERTEGFFPVNIQAKNEARIPNFHTLLKEMPKENVPNVIALKLTSKATSKFMKQGEYAIMNFDSFLNYLKIEKELKELKKKIAMNQMDFLNKLNPE